jgi:hypothetical protein
LYIERSDFKEVRSSVKILLFSLQSWSEPSVWYHSTGLSQINPVHTTLYYIRSILILSMHLHLGLPNGLFPSDFPTYILYALPFSPICATYVMLKYIEILPKIIRVYCYYSKNCSVLYKWFLFRGNGACICILIFNFWFFMGMWVLYIWALLVLMIVHMNVCVDYFEYILLVSMAPCHLVLVVCLKELRICCVDVIVLYALIVIFVFVHLHFLTFYMLSLLSILYLHKSTGSSFQQQTFPFLWVLELSPCLSRSSSLHIPTQLLLSPEESL